MMVLGKLILCCPKSPSMTWPQGRMWFVTSGGKCPVCGKVLWPKREDKKAENEND